MLEQVTATIARYRMCASGERVGVAVSGGADSVCLLHVLVELAPRWDLRLSVLHLNHQLRGEASDADERFVRELAAALGLEFHSARVDAARAASEAGDNLEQAARRLRREFFHEVRERAGLDRVALGHTRSDQAETVLFRFLRGAGTAGLAGILPVTREGVIRPLIECGREEVERFLRERDIAWREDASNQDRAYARNRIRHDLLPALSRDWNPCLQENLAALANVARDEEEFWAAEVERLVEGKLIGQPPAILFEANWIRTLAKAMARRVIRRAIQAAKGDLRAIDLLHVERILELTNTLEGSGRVQIPGLDVLRSFDWVRMAPPGLYGREERDYEFEVQAPCRILLPAPAGPLDLEVVGRPTAAAASVYNGNGSELDWGRIAGTLCVRNWRPGDQYRPVGHACETKIKLLFQEARIPLWERRRWPVITCKNSIIWAAKFGPAAEYAATSHTRTILRVRELAGGTEL